MGGAATFVLGANATGRPRSLDRGTSGVVALDVGPGRLAVATPLDGPPGALTAADGSLWVADPGGEAVSRLAPSSGREIDRIALGSEPGSITMGAGAIWVASTVGSTVTRIDPTARA